MPTYQDEDGDGMPHVGNKVRDHDGIPDHPDQGKDGLRRYVSGVKGGTHRIHLRYAVMNRRVGQLRNFQRFNLRLSGHFRNINHNSTVQLETNWKTK